MHRSIYIFSLCFKDSNEHIYFYIFMDITTLIYMQKRLLNKLITRFDVDHGASNCAEKWKT